MPANGKIHSISLTSSTIAYACILFSSKQLYLFLYLCNASAVSGARARRVRFLREAAICSNDLNSILIDSIKRREYLDFEFSSCMFSSPPLTAGANMNYETEGRRSSLGGTEHSHASLRVSDDDNMHASSTTHS